MKFLKLFLLFGLVSLAAVGCARRPLSRQPGGNFPGSPTPSQPASPQEQAYIDQVRQSINKTVADNQQAADSSKTPLAFSANLFFAHEAIIPYISLQTLKQYADGLKAAGVSRIDINLGLKPWLNNDQTTIGKYNDLISYIQQQGLAVALNPQFSKGDASVSSVQDYQDKALPIFKTWASQYHPEIFIVAHEPYLLNMQMGIQGTPQQWRDFVQTAAQTVKQASPNTKVGAGAEYYELPYFKLWPQIPELDYLTVNIYNMDKLDTYSQMIDLAKQGGKQVYIEETWRPIYNASGAQNALAAAMQGIGNPVFASLDQQWLKAIVIYAKAKGLAAVTPFWTTTFFAYAGSGNATDPAYVSAVTQALNYGQRTDTFSAYQTLIKQYDN